MSSFRFTENSLNSGTQTRQWKHPLFEATSSDVLPTFLCLLFLEGLWNPGSKTPQEHEDLLPDRYRCAEWSWSEFSVKLATYKTFWLVTVECLVPVEVEIYTCFWQEEFLGIFHERWDTRERFTQQDTCGAIPSSRPHQFGDASWPRDGNSKGLTEGGGIALSHVLTELGSLTCTLSKVCLILFLHSSWMQHD